MAIRIRPPGRHFKKARAGNAEEILKKLADYLKGNCDEPAEILCGFWRDQANVFTYQELRQAVISGALNEETFREWSRDYSLLVQNKLRFMWENAISAGAISQPITGGLTSYVFNVERPAVMAWIEQQTGTLVTNSVIEQREAISYLLEKTVIEHHSVDELARLIRPCVGLTKPQAKANLKYYDNMVKTLREDHPRMKEATIQKRAREAAAKYAERQHRQRAETIAETEMASAYNKGADEGVRQAQEEGLLGKVVKRWCTSGDDMVCEQCRALEGTEIAMDDAWPFRRGWSSGENLTPPAHPRCACAVEYIEE